MASTSTIAGIVCCAAGLATGQVGLCGFAHTSLSLCGRGLVVRRWMIKGQPCWESRSLLCVVRGLVGLDGGRIFLAPTLASFLECGNREMKSFRAVPSWCNLGLEYVGT